MENVLIPLVIVVVMLVLVVALMRIAPRFDKEMANAFEEFGMRHALRYWGEDDGRAREFAADFDGVMAGDASAESGSPPKRVVNGVLDGQGMFVFRRDDSDGDTGRDWVVAGLELKKPLADRCAVQFCRVYTDRETDYLSDPVVKEHEVGASIVVVRAPDAASAGRLVEDEVLEQILERAGHLPFRPEIQVRGERVIAYPADRHTTIAYAKELDGLMGLVKRTVNLAG